MSYEGDTTSTIFQYCIKARSEKFAILECITDRLENMNDHNELSYNSRKFLILLSAALVFFMQAGFAMICAGAVREKNVQNTMLKNLLDACSTLFAFYCVGYAFAFGGEDHYTYRDNNNSNVNSDAISSTTNFMGSTGFFSSGDIDLAFWFFQGTVSAAAVTIVAGSVAERCQMSAYLLYSMFLSGFVYPIVAHAAWSQHGFLSPNNNEPLFGIGMIDFAGGGVVHLTGGAVALYAVYILGSRRGRFYDVHTGEELSEPKIFKAYSIALQVIGTFFLWFGWIGFNAGSALLITDEERRVYIKDISDLAAVNTCLSASTGAISALLLDTFLEHRRTGDLSYNLVSSMNGCLSGLVAVTAGCGTVDNWAAFVIGITAGILYVVGSKLLLIYKIDDVVDAVPIHMFNGIWGVIATGLFSSPDLVFRAYGTDNHPGLLYSIAQGSFDLRLLSCQIFGVLFIVGWTLATMFPFFLALDCIGWFRTETLSELVGMDMLYHNEKDPNLDDLVEDNDDDDKVMDDYLDAFVEYKTNLAKRRGFDYNSTGKNTRSSASGVRSVHSNSSITSYFKGHRAESDTLSQNTKASRKSNSSNSSRRSFQNSSIRSLQNSLTYLMPNGLRQNTHIEEEGKAEEEEKAEEL